MRARLTRRIVGDYFARVPTHRVAPHFTRVR